MHAEKTLQMSIPTNTCVFCHAETNTLERHMGTHNEAPSLRYYVHGAKLLLFTPDHVSHHIPGATYVLKQDPRGYRCPFEDCDFAALPYELYKHAKEHVKIIVRFS